MKKRNLTTIPLSLALTLLIISCSNSSGDSASRVVHAVNSNESIESLNTQESEATSSDTAESTAEESVSSDTTESVSSDTTESVSSDTTESVSSDTRVTLQVNPALATAPIQERTTDQVNRAVGKLTRDLIRSNSSKSYLDKCDNYKRNLEAMAVIPYVRDAIITDELSLLYARTNFNLRMDGFEGTSLLSAPNVEYIKNTKGYNIILGQEGEDNIIDKIQGYEGLLIICGMDVLEISDISGGVVVINGNVNLVRGSSTGVSAKKVGAIYVINGDIDRVTGFKGYLAAPEGQIRSADAYTDAYIKDSDSKGVPILTIIRRLFGGNSGGLLTF